MKARNTIIRCSSHSLFIINFILIALVLPLAVPQMIQAAATTADISVPVDNLRVILRPLPREELAEEMSGWMKLLQAKITQSGQAELQFIDLKEKAETTKVSEKEMDKLKERMLELRFEEAELHKRTNVVVNALKMKGGDVEAAEQYLAAVSDLSNTADTTSRIAAITAATKSWFNSADGGQDIVRRGIKVLIILFFFWILSKYAGRVVAKAVGQRKEISTLLTDFAKRSAGGLMLIVGLLMAISAMGVEIGPLMAALGAGGFIVGFALQETLGSFASGLMIMIYRPFDVDDYVALAGVEGKVQQMSLVSTTLLTFDNKVHVLPNQTAWGGTITNYTGRPVRRVDLIFGIGYGDDIPHAMKVLNEVASAHELVLKKPLLTIEVVELGDSSVNLACRPWVKSANYWQVYWELTRLVKMRFDEEGITIPYPQRDVHMHSTQAKAVE